MTKEIKPFDPSKPVETRGGRPARILCTDAKGTLYPIVALVEEQPGEEIVRRFTKNGRFLNGHSDYELDLVNVPARESKWRQVYPGGVIGGLFSSRDSARLSKTCSGLRVIGLLRVDFEDGVFVGIEFERLDDLKKET